MLCNEFDSSLKALVNPEEQFRPIAGFPEICVMAFSAHIVEKCLERYGGEQIADVPFCTGRVPIYRVVIDGTEVALSMPHVGGPAASAFIEEVWPRGGKYFVFFGAALYPGQNLDHRRLLPGDPGQDGAPQGPRLRVRGDGVRRPGGSGPVPGAAVCPVLLHHGQPGRPRVGQRRAPPEGRVCHRGVHCRRRGNRPQAAGAVTTRGGVYHG